MHVQHGTASFDSCRSMGNTDSVSLPCDHNRPLVERHLAAGRAVERSAGGTLDWWTTQRVGGACATGPFRTARLRRKINLGVHVCCGGRWGVAQWSARRSVGIGAGDDGRDLVGGPRRGVGAAAAGSCTDSAGRPYRCHSTRWLIAATAPHAVRRRYGIWGCFDEKENKVR